MDQFIDRRLGRRSIIRGAAAGAGAIGLGLSGAGRFGSLAWAQEASPAASEFDAAACYQPFGDAQPVQYEKLADPPYNIALSNSYIGNVWRTQMIKMAKAYAESPDIAPLISEFQVNTADRDDAAQQAAIENMISNGAQAVVILANTPTALV
jgi:ribose transport system substrate-binding protein